MLMINHLGGFILIILNLYEVIGSTRSRKGMSVIGWKHAFLYSFNQPMS